MCLTKKRVSNKLTQNTLNHINKFLISSYPDIFNKSVFRKQLFINLVHITIEKAVKINQNKRSQQQKS